MRYEFKTTPYEHQSGALKAADGRPFFAYFMEMGTGKTKVAIDEMCILKSRGEIDAAVVLAPKGVYLNWMKREIPTHMPERYHAPGRIVEWRSGGGGKGHQRLLGMILRPPESKKALTVLVMNIEALSSGTKGRIYLRKFLEAHRCYMVVDESTFIKNPSSNRAKWVTTLGRKAVYRRIMTGSPVTKSPLDLYSQCEFLTERALGFRSFYSFRARYAVLREMVFGGRNVRIVVGYRNVEDLTTKVKRLSYRVTKEECLDLPPKIYQRRDVELTKEQIRAYNEMREYAIAELDSGEFVSASAVITQILRLHQVICGHVTDDEGEVHPVNSNRVSVLMDVLGETSGKSIIWSRFRKGISDVVEAIKKEYGEESVAEYHGGNTATREDDAVRFINDPACRFMVSNTQSGGYGNTWTVANTVIYFSNDYDLEKRMQSEDRAHRSGQTKSVTYVDLVSPGTVDEKILSALRKKINIADTIMDEGYREWII